MVLSHRLGIRCVTREAAENGLSSLRATRPGRCVRQDRTETCALVYHPDLIRHPDGCPALVLNADYTPLSYYPLSLWPWQTAIKAMFLERVDSTLR